MKAQQQRAAILCSCCGQVDLTEVEEALQSRDIFCWRHDGLCTEDGTEFIAGRMAGANLEGVLICACADEDKARLWRRTAAAEDVQPIMTSVIGLRDLPPDVRRREVLMAAAYQKNMLPVSVREAVSVPQKVLVLGSSAAGLRAVIDLAEAGYDVTVADEEELARRALSHLPPDLSGHNDVCALRDRVAESDRVCVRAPVQVTGIEGQVGGFAATFAHADGHSSADRFGAIVLAPGCEPVQRGEFLGVDVGAEVVPVSQFDDAMAREEGLSVLAGVRPHQVAFVVPSDATDTEVPFMSAVRAARRTRRVLNADVYLLCNDAKVTASGMERAYRDLRDDGVTVIRFDEETLSLEEADVPHTYTDPGEMAHPLTLRFAGEDLDGAGGAGSWELPCDRVFVADQLRLSRMGERLADLLELRRGADGFLGDDNIFQLPVDTNRRGIFVVGSAGRPKTAEAGRVDAANAVLSVQDLLGGGVMTVDHAAAIVQGEKCALCLTCIRSCPHTAISVDEDEGAAVVHREACQGCGICAGECPADAIQLEGYSDDSFAAALDVLRGVQ